jgi:hypothetical protein
MVYMRDLRDALMHGVLGAVGAVSATLSGIALGIAAVISALIGMLSFVLSPLRALLDRVRGG